MSSNRNPNRNQVQQNLKHMVAISLLLGMFFWSVNAHMAFWLRRFFVVFAGMTALAYLLLFLGSKLVKTPYLRLVGVFLIVSALTLLVRPAPISGLIGVPHVHPSLLSLLSAVVLAYFAHLAFKPRLFLQYCHVTIIVWAVLNLFSWATLEKFHGRLGFLDSQIIYASYLFMLGIVLAIWLRQRNMLSKKLALISISFLGFCLLLSQTRSAILLTVIAVIILLRKRQLDKKHFAIVGLAAVLSGVLASVYFTRLMDIPYFKESAAYRQQLVLSSFPQDKSQLLFGGGMQSIERNIRVNSLNFDLIWPDIQTGIRFESSHNYVADILVERGIATVLLLCIIIMYAFWCWAKNRNRLTNLYSLLLGVTCAYFFVNNINIQMEIILWICIVGLFVHSRSSAYSEK
jgi:O-Antigen ligase